MPTLPLLGHTVHFSDSGAPTAAPAGAPVVALHSGGLSSRQWSKLAALLSPRHRVLAPDFLGCGGSSPWPQAPGTPPYHFTVEIDLICALLDTLPGPVHLVGHSFGGLVAVRAALRNPERVLSLGLFEPVTFGLLDGASAEERAAFAQQMSPMADPALVPGGEPWLQIFIDWWQGPSAWQSLPPPAKAQFLAVGPKIYAEVTTLWTDRMTADELLPLRAPTLVLRSERSPQPARRTAELLAAALPRGTLRQLDGVGHLAPVTHAGLVNELLAANIEAAEEQQGRRA
jgi:pimeloyl-ACP methyl ester carboxylesterase